MPAILVHVPPAPLLNGQPRIEQMSRMQQDLVAAHMTKSDRFDRPEAPKMLRRIAAKARKPRVAIVGAGFAGLKAADILLRHGVNVTIFEARDRLGGRLFQSKVGTHTVDMGPNWIHGTQNNPILDLVHSTETATHDWGERQVAFGPDGTEIPEELAGENAEMLWSLIGEAFKYSNACSAQINEKTSLMDYIRDHVDEKLVSQMMLSNADAEEMKHRKGLVLKLAEMWGGFIGATTSTQSLRFLWLEECLEGENLFCAGTYEKVLEHVSTPALKAGVVKLKHVVNKLISTDEAKVTVGLEGRGTETFDEVIVTCPLGWLKRNKSVFEPELPKRMSEAIDELGYGNLDKVYITFSKPWWDSPATQTSELTAARIQEAKSEAPNLTATTAPLRQMTPIERSNEEHYVGFTTFIAPEYAKDTNPKGWIQDCINLAALPAGCEHPTLLFYISGPTADHIAKILRDHSSGGKSKVDAELWRFFEPYVSRLPNYQPGDKECQPVDVLATGWTNDKFAGYGSYTNFPVGSTRCDESVECLREGAGLVERGVWLAGEHTAPFVALGTVTGAYWAGEAVAKRILDAWGVQA
ncbi:uncharacterized protein PV09_05310 [Verruconis gallopava]|uniref:Amine oxidase domain-containing protein n=1 Tax=Verruconis gallopava TaxID=253628 RepID=A0A0D2AWN2_9PEZI|nr:uncharacterized protein PV09_05310 [Verruconis gallopava]KIW03549.1 hypothetical protein PV09_05310 [Verruconis gallopava]